MVCGLPCLKSEGHTLYTSVELELSSSISIHTPCNSVSGQQIYRNTLRKSSFLSVELLRYTYIQVFNPRIKVS